MRARHTGPFTLLVAALVSRNRLENYYPTSTTTDYQTSDIRGSMLSNTQAPTQFWAVSDPKSGSCDNEEVRIKVDDTIKLQHTKYLNLRDPKVHIIIPQLPRIWLGTGFRTGVVKLCLIQGVASHLMIYVPQKGL